MRVVLALVVFCGCGFHANPSIDGAPGTGDGHPSDTPGSDTPGSDGPGIDAPMIDAPMIDAPPDAALTLTLLETLSISCRGATLTSATTLQAGQLYHLRTSGECVANTANNSKADAEYLGYNVGPTYDVFNNVDAGIAVNDNTSGATKQPRWGAFTNTHLYEVPWTGVGAKITVNYHGDNLTNNSGSLTFQIFTFE
jgi:hypothetical protein